MKLDSDHFDTALDLMLAIIWGLISFAALRYSLNSVTVFGQLASGGVAGLTGLSAAISFTEWLSAIVDK